MHDAALITCDSFTLPLARPTFTLTHTTLLNDLSVRGLIEPKLKGL